METSLTYLTQEYSGPAALRLAPPAREDRTPAYFIALLDVSDSMSDSSKLVHVKHCMSLLLKFLTPADEIALVTFGESASIVLRRSPATTDTLPVVEQSIQSLRTDGCTNLSAGLACVRELLDEARAAGDTHKPGLLLLTDGHANRGVYDVAALRGMFQSLHQTAPDLTCSFVAYGTDHNSDLLKSLAEDTHGSYSVVESLESAALAMGESLGSVISCVAQNVVVQCPAGTKLTGPQRISDDGRIELGDLYAGCEVLLLLDLPAGGAAITVKGSSVPSLDPFQLTVTSVSTDTSRNVGIELTRLRYRCSDLFRRIRVGSEGEAALRAEVAEFRTAVADEAYNGQAVAEMLRGEIPSLESALQMRFSPAAGGRINNYLTTQLLQHEAYTSLGRGTSQPIVPEPAGARRYVRFGLNANAGTDSEDEEDPAAQCAPPPPMAANTSYLSPTSSVHTRRVAMAMRTSSQQEPPPPAVTVGGPPRPSGPLNTPPRGARRSPPGAPAPLRRAASA
jgi:Mg-chelatase subunit ChlD